MWSASATSSRPGSAAGLAGRGAGSLREHPLEVVECVPRLGAPQVATAVDPFDNANGVSGDSGAALIAEPLTAQQLRW
jgi:hypothetical protein